MSGLFDIGKSGLTSYRQALAVTGQNIANINTDGYKRRNVELEEVTGGNSGIASTSKSTGLGVRVDQIRRSFDEFLLNKVRSSNADAGSSSTFLQSVKQIQDLIMPGESNLSTAIGKFFSDLQEVSTNPSSISARTLALEGARQMTDSFSQIAIQLESFKDGLETRASQQLAEVNVLTEEIAQINLQLSTASSTQQNNALLDARDAAIDRLSEFLEIDVVLDRKGAGKTTLGSSTNGPVIVGIGEATNLGVIQSHEKLSFILGPGEQNIPTAQVTGGSVHGFAAAYDIANEMLAEIDSLAFKLVREVNVLHNNGINLEGDKGGDLFRNIDIKVDANPTNIGDSSAEFQVIDYDLVESEKVTFSFNDQQNLWTGRNDFGDVVASGRQVVTLPGVQIRFIGEPKQFDQFIYNPVSGTAAGMSVVIQRPEDIAAASPILVSADPGNDSAAIMSVTPVKQSSSSSLPSIEDIFSNNLASVAATEFLAGGPIAKIPAKVENLEILSLAKQSQAQLLFAESDLNGVNSLTLSLSDAATGVTGSTDNITFDLSYQTVRGFAGSWIDAGDIADLMNIGVIVGTNASTGEVLNLSQLGGFASGKGGNLNISLSSSPFVSASAGTVEGNTIEATVNSAVDNASDVHIFTREGRHISGRALSDELREKYETMMTVENGFHAGAIYLDTYLNADQGQGYLETDVRAIFGGAVNIDVQQGTDITTATFEVFEGVDTNQGSVDGLSSVARNASYTMSVGGIVGNVNGAELSEPTGENVASAMISSLRRNAPIASLIGDPAKPADGDEVNITFEGQVYTVSMQDGEPIVSGGEASRLTAFFDKNDRLHVVSNSGTIGKSSFALHLDNDNLGNQAAAERFGFANGDGVFANTLYSDTEFSVDIPGHAAGNNVIEMTFNEDDVYRLKFVFDGMVDTGGAASSDKEIGIGNVIVSSGSAQAVADAINDAIANNLTDGDGGADLTGIATAVAVDNKVTLTIAGAEGVSISTLGSSVADGEGTVTIDPITTGGDAVTLSKASEYVAKNFDVRREGDSIIAYALDDASPPLVGTGSTSLAKQRYILSSLPEEDLIVFVGDEGAKRLTMQYDTVPEDVVQPHRDTSIRVVDPIAGVIEFFDVETNTSLATRTLDDEQMAHAIDVEVSFDGELAAQDTFLIADNSLGKGDNRNLQAILDLQLDNRSTTGKGGFQQVFNTSVARLGAIVSSSAVAAEANEAMRGASLEAEAAYSGVNLDVEAANLIEQQQAYQASARILSTAREIFDTLLQNL